jgi:hypothetical protein
MRQGDIEKRIEYVDGMAAHSQTAVFAKEIALALWEIAMELKQIPKLGDDLRVRTVAGFAGPR